MYNLTFFWLLYAFWPPNVIWVDSDNIVIRTVILLILSWLLWGKQVSKVLFEFEGWFSNYYSSLCQSHHSILKHTTFCKGFFYISTPSKFCLSVLILSCARVLGSPWSINMRPTKWYDLSQMFWCITQCIMMIYHETRIQWIHKSWHLVLNDIMIYHDVHFMIMIYHDVKSW